MQLLPLDCLHYNIAALQRPRPPPVPANRKIDPERSPLTPVPFQQTRGTRTLSMPRPATSHVKLVHCGRWTTLVEACQPVKAARSDRTLVHSYLYRRAKLPLCAAAAGRAHSHPVFHAPCCGTSQSALAFLGRGNRRSTLMCCSWRYLWREVCGGVQMVTMRT